MSFGEPDETDPARMVEAHDKVIPVSTDFEDDPVAADNARACVDGLDIRGRGPVRLGRDSGDRQAVEVEPVALDVVVRRHVLQPAGVG